MHLQQDYNIDMDVGIVIVVVIRLVCYIWRDAKNCHRLEASGIALCGWNNFSLFHCFRLVLMEYDFLGDNRLRNLFYTLNIDTRRTLLVL